MAARTKATIFRRGALALSLLLIGVGSLMSAMALGGTQNISDDYGIRISAVVSQHEECEEGEVWVPSTTNPIAGECVAE